MNDQNIYLIVVGAIVRWALVLAGGVLVERHILTGVQVERFSTDVVQHLALAVPIVVPLAWSLIGKIRAHLQRDGWL